MTLDEAIKHCLEVARSCDCQAAQCDEDGYEGHIKAENEQCASDHRQLAEWLTELKEAKRLLKLAIDDFAKMDYHIYDCDKSCDDCPLSGERDHCLKWRYYDEAFALIGE